MKTAVFSTRTYDRRFLDAANAEGRHTLHYLEPRLNRETAALAAGCEAVCLFINDEAGAEVLPILAEGGIRWIVLRSAGFNHVDLKEAARLGIRVARVPAYSPHAVAEHALALIMTLNRKTHRAYNRVRDGNFALEGLLGFDVHGTTAGIIGTGKIGCLLGGILAAMGCRVLGFDVAPSDGFRAAGGAYTELEDLLRQADIVSLHCPLTPDTHHLINERTVAMMKPGVMLINTSRGGLVDTRAVMDGLKSERIGYLGLDVYEQEADVFYENLSETVIQDDVLQRLLTFPNVLLTSHQAFFTDTALQNIAETTVKNLNAFAMGGASENEVSWKPAVF
jgi:D-lactate dehydrogenase